MVLSVFAGMAYFERSLIVERTSAGRSAAKARGVRFGPQSTLSAEKITPARKLIEQDTKPVTEVARLLGVHRATRYRARSTFRGFLGICGERDVPDFTTVWRLSGRFG